ncbi:hypothetical protein [Fretibacter rubidus]|uniref:hypothetical protein n=1 Tax=Fretibacter rubidus TaxID=570162 RepID=UPI00352B3448
MTNHRTIRGTIAYTSKKPDRMNQERGREFFTLTQQSDGTSVLHAHCEIDDAPDVIRDITSCFDTQTMKPRDGASRLTIGGKFEGSGWFYFTDSACELEVYNVKTGRASEAMPLDTPATWFGNHAIVNDGFLGKFFPLGCEPGKRRIANVMMSSPDHRGATGPELFPLSFGLIYTGNETITVGAGTFEARRFEVVDTAEGLPEEHPPYVMWTTNDEDGIFLRGGVDGYMMTHYELVELSR